MKLPALSFVTFYQDMNSQIRQEKHEAKVRFMLSVGTYNLSYKVIKELIPQHNQKYSQNKDIRYVRSLKSRKKDYSRQVHIKPR